MNLDNKIKSRLSKVMDIDYLLINNDTDKHVNHKKRVKRHETTRLTYRAVILL